VDRDRLAALYTLNEGLDAGVVRDAAAALPFRLPDDYARFLTLSNGLYSGDRLVLLELEDLAGRNQDYEIQRWLPGHVMIGDDSGGTAILMAETGAEIFESGMGDLDPAGLRVSAPSLEALLIDLSGKTLDQRE
jgi:hypothetical protein